LNPDARLILTDRSRVEAGQIMGTGLFDHDRAHEHPLWAKELYGFADHVPETEEYGVSSFVYSARRPFDPARVHAVLNSPLPGVIRAKGHFWLATRPDWVAEFSLAGALSSVKPLGTWWAAVPKDRWLTQEAARDYMAEKWVEPWGDRRQELVFIGTGMDRTALTAALDACLVGQEGRFRPQDWTRLADPFPTWRKDAG
jgi:G3E family GTPase